MRPKIGERGGTRTHDPLIKSQMLYRLSYALPHGMRSAYSLVPQGSIEVRRVLVAPASSAGVARGFETGKIVAGVMR
jgi:hypothetical protein